MVRARAIIILLFSLITCFSQPFTSSDLAWHQKRFAVTRDQLFWLKADFGVYRDFGTNSANDGDIAYQWNDASPSQYNVSATAFDSTAPIFLTNILNGLPVVRFRGAAMIKNPATLNQPQTFVAVVRVNSENTGSGSPSVFVGQLGSIHFGRNIGDGKAIVWGSSIASPYIEGPSLNLNQWYTVSFVMNGASSFIRIDGGSSYSGDIGSSGFNVIAIGADSAGGPMIGDIAEIIRYNRALTLSELSMTEAYLKTKWGL
jgi:hypothetical protein